MADTNTDIDATELVTFTRKLSTWLSEHDLTAGDIVQIAVPALSVGLTHHLTGSEVPMVLATSACTALWSKLVMSVAKNAEEIDPDGSWALKTLVLQGASLGAMGVGYTLCTTSDLGGSMMMLANGVQTVVSVIRYPNGEGAEDREKAD